MSEALSQWILDLHEILAKKRAKAHVSKFVECHWIFLAGCRGLHHKEVAKVVSLWILSEIYTCVHVMSWFHKCTRAKAEELRNSFSLCIITLISCFFFYSYYKSVCSETAIYWLSLDFYFRWFSLSLSSWNIFFASIS